MCVEPRRINMINFAKLSLLAITLLATGSAFAQVKLLQKIDSSDYRWGKAVESQVKAASASSPTRHVSVVALSSNALEQQAVLVDSPDGSTLQLLRENSEKHPLRESWSGSTSDKKTWLFLVIEKGKVTGSLIREGVTYKLQPTSEVSISVFSRAAVVDKPDHSSSAPPSRPASGQRGLTPITTGATGQSGNRAQAFSDPIVDLIVVLTPYARANLSDSDIQFRVDQTSAAYNNTQVPLRARLVEIFAISNFNESASLLDRLYAFRARADVEARRKFVGADFAVLLTAPGNDCGRAFPGPDNENPYAVVAVDCLDGYSFTHEIGHLQGADHNFEQKSFGTVYNFDWPSMRDNHTFTDANGVAWEPCYRTIMASPDVVNYYYEAGYKGCQRNGFRILYFSNPDITYSLHKIGDTRFSNNRRKLTETASSVASFLPSNSAGNQSGSINKVLDIIRSIINIE